ncbi:MAG: helix-turn-helix transcriptional regulator, partial [Methylophilales bacterium]|nr:helix-turn-helix transcriptional regulator [Methylophilales bacterium]
MQNNIANTLRFLRKEQKMTLVQLAQKTGVNTSSLSRIERGDINMTVDLLGRIG